MSAGDFHPQFSQEVYATRDRLLETLTDLSLESIEWSDFSDSQQEQFEGAINMLHEQINKEADTLANRLDAEARAAWGEAVGKGHSAL